MIIKSLSGRPTPKFDPPEGFRLGFRLQSKCWNANAFSFSESDKSKLWNKDYYSKSLAKYRVFLWGG